MKTSELTGAALDWAVAKCEDETDVLFAHRQYGKLVVRQAGCHETHDSEWPYAPSTNWAQGGPIIEREGIGFTQFSDYPQWTAKHPQAICFDGPTPLVAAMRCFVASNLGDDVEIPKELT